MGKTRFNLTFLIIGIILFGLFIYSGLEIINSETEMMKWVGAKFVFTNLTTLIGVLYILTIVAYLFLKKKYY